MRVWEGKTTSGLRSWSNTYTNLGDKSANDASTYVDQVNASALCGYTDWRMPSLEELRGLVDFGNLGIPNIDNGAFPHTAPREYWTGTVAANDSSRAWLVLFTSNGSRKDFSFQKSTPMHVRLVRGGVQWAGPQYLVTTVAYPSAAAPQDGPNNAVTDRRTGLTWRRCLEGQQWTGSACTGMPTEFAHEAALTHTRSPQFLWRLPNVKELQTLVDVRRSDPAHDTAAFPGDSQRVNLWSSTPSAYSIDYAMAVLFESFGNTEWSDRDSYGPWPIRLVMHNGL